MHGYLAALTIVLLVGMVLTRVILMRRTGTRAVRFGRTDRTDFLIPPFALFYILYRVRRRVRPPHRQHSALAASSLISAPRSIRAARSARDEDVAGSQDRCPVARPDDRPGSARRGTCGR